MKTLTLNHKQRSILIDALQTYHDEEGNFSADIEIDDSITVNATGSVETEGYIEDDYHCGYMNGTGAWIETYRHAWVELTAEVYNEETDTYETMILDAETIAEAENSLNRE